MFETLAELNIKIGEAEDRGDFEWLNSVLAPRMAFYRANKTFEDELEYIKRIKDAYCSSTNTIESPLSSPLINQDFSELSSPLTCIDEVEPLSPLVNTSDNELLSPLTYSPPHVYTEETEPSSPLTHIDEKEPASPLNDNCIIKESVTVSSPLMTTVNPEKKDTRITKIIEPIEIYGNRAIVKCIVKLDGKEYHNIRLFVCRNGDWKLLGWANELY